MDMARTDQPDAESPMPRAPVDPSLKHELLRATWQWQPTSPGLRFVVPAESNQTTLFWMHEPEREKVRWMMLLGGDVTPWIAVPVAAAITHGWAALLWAVAGVFAAELLPGRRWETGR